MLPHFLSIGAQKSGTTWLYKNLKNHPQIWMPPIKEIHYFDQTNLKRRIFRINETKYKRELKVAKKRIKNYADFCWYLRYFLWRPNDDWYSSLFKPEEGQIAGDITPKYSIINPQEIRRIHSLMPHVKLILLLRNPIERIWSQANRRYRQGLYKEGCTSDDIIEQFLKKENTYLRSNYLALLENWETVFPSNQIFIGFFEQIKEDPEALLSDIHRFLGIAYSGEYIPDFVREKKLEGNYKPIPEKWANFLAIKYHSELRELHERFNNKSTASWLAYAEKYL